MIGDGECTRLNLGLGDLGRLVDGDPGGVFEGGVCVLTLDVDGLSTYSLLICSGKLEFVG